MRNMMALIIFLWATSAKAGNYAECILDKMPGTANDIAANAVFQICLSQYPNGLAVVEQGSGRGFLRFKSGAECTAKKAEDTRSNRAAILISTACRRLYDQPVPWDQFDPVTATPAK